MCMDASNIVVPVALTSATVSAIVTAALVLTVIGLITARKKSGGPNFEQLTLNIFKI